VPLKQAEWERSRTDSATAGRYRAPVDGVLALQRTAGNKAVAGLLSGAGSNGGGVGADLPAVGATRKRAFADRARSLGLDMGQIDQLWQTAGTSSSSGFAPAVERTGALFSAARRASAAGIPAFYVELKVGKLAELNSTLGHSRADAMIATARSTAVDELVAAVGQVQPLGDRASTFGFLVTGADGSAVTETNLVSSARAVAASVGQRLGLSLTSEVMDVDDAATSAVIADQARDESARAARTDLRSGDGRRDGARFTSAGAERRREFFSLAQSFGLEAGAASGLYAMLLQGRADTLTGFEGDADRVDTVLKAAGEAKRTGTGAVYVEVDVRNLGGLNRSLGRAKADAAFARMASIADREMRSVSDLGDAWPFRHGGDEFSFVIVARRPGISAGQLEFAVGAALTRASSMIRAMTSDLAGIAHTKPTGRPGTGIVWATSVIAPGANPSAVFSAADRKVEQKKSLRGGVTMPVPGK
jgi:GGDEF domain-containing protein